MSSSREQVWTPDAIRRQCALYVSDAERAGLHKRFAPAAGDGSLYTDAVFEGGGVRGFAFGGVLQAFADFGIRFRNVAGTSAGASGCRCLTGSSMV